MGHLADVAELLGGENPTHALYQKCVCVCVCVCERERERERERKHAHEVV